MTQKFVDTIQQEVAEEKAGALGRAGRRLQHALDLLRAEGETGAQRERLLWELAERVESFIVQREACGLRDSRRALAYYGVPTEAVARVGARRPGKASA